MSVVHDTWGNEPVPSTGLTEEQFDLLNRHSAPWLTLWMISDFAAARDYAVASLACGAGGGRWWETTSKGMRGWVEGTHADGVAVTWPEVRRWSAGLPAAVRKRARELRVRGIQIQAEFPQAAPSIGRPYCWDVRDGEHQEPTCPQCEQDRADLDAANARRSVAIAHWYRLERAHVSEVRAFLASLRPVNEVDLFGAVVR